MERIKLEYVKNFRDLGGYLTSDNKVTNFNRIYRSSVPTTLTDKEREFFRRNNLKTIIDLRNKEEITKKKNAFSNFEEFNYYNIPLRGGDFPKKEKDIPYGYLDIIDDLDSIKEVFKTIRDSKGSILINCNAGKDRTGVICMLILLLCNVLEEEILVDYQVSYTYLKETIRKMHLDNPKMPKYLGNSKMEYMEDALKLFKDKYESIDNYMMLLGFTKKDILKIVKKLVD